MIFIFALFSRSSVRAIFFFHSLRLRVAIACVQPPSLQKNKRKKSRDGAAVQPRPQGAFVAIFWQYF